MIEKNDYKREILFKSIVRGVVKIKFDFSRYLTTLNIIPITISNSHLFYRSKTQSDLT